MLYSENCFNQQVAFSGKKIELFCFLLQACQLVIETSFKVFMY